MIQLYTCSPYTSLIKIRPIPLNTGGVSTLQLESYTDACHKLTIVIYPKLGSVYDFYFNNTDEGIRLIHKMPDGYNLDLVFVENNEERKLMANGELHMVFYSDLWRLKSEDNPNESTVITGKLKDILPTISPNFIFQPAFSLDGEIFVTLTIGEIDSFDMFGDIIGASMSLINGQIISFRQIGVINIGGVEKSLVQYGTLKNLPAIADATNSYRILNNDDKTIGLDTPDVSYVGKPFTLVKPMLKMSGGSITSSNVYITDSSFATNPAYPLVLSPRLHQNSQKWYFVRNTAIVSKAEKYKRLIIDFSPNAQDINNQITNYTSAQQYLYKQAIAFLQSQSSNLPILNFSVMEIPRIYLSGSNVNLHYVDTSKEVDGIRKPINYQGIKYLTDLKYDLSNLK
jgi:hypothetical protein